jgi:hypothetical protein
MARKVINRKELREQADAAEKAGLTEGGAPKKKAPVKRKSRAKTVADVRVRLYWGVYSQSLKLVAKYDYSAKKSAEKKAEELNAGGKSPHFVQKVREEIKE